MKTWTVAAVAVALAGCAGARTPGNDEFASGHWTGQIARDGSSQPLAVYIARENGAYRGEVRSAAGARAAPLESVQVHGDQVQFETDELRFVGEVKGSRLAGTVSHKPEDARVGDFSVTAADGEGSVHSPASEWSPFDLY